MAQPGGLTLRFAVHLVFTGTYFLAGWFGSRVVSVLDSGAEGPGFKSQLGRCRITVLGKLFTPILSLFTKQRIGSSPLDGCEGNCGLGSLPPGLWLKSPAGWLRKTGISSGTLRSVIEYGLPLAFFYFLAYLTDSIRFWVYSISVQSDGTEHLTSRRKVCIQLPSHADNVALPAFARRTPAVQQSIDISCPPGPQQQTCSQWRTSSTVT